MILAIFSADLNGDFWKDKDANQFNTDYDCGVNGMSRGSTEHKWEFAVGMGLCIIGFVFSFAQMFTFCYVDSEYDG